MIREFEATGQPSARQGGKIRIYLLEIVLHRHSPLVYPRPTKRFDTNLAGAVLSAPINVRDTVPEGVF